MRTERPKGKAKKIPRPPRVPLGNAACRRPALQRPKVFAALAFFHSEFPESMKLNHLNEFGPYSSTATPCSETKPHGHDRHSCRIKSPGAFILRQAQDEGFEGWETHTQIVITRFIRVIQSGIQTALGCENEPGNGSQYHTSPSPAGMASH